MAQYEPKDIREIFRTLEKDDARAAITVAASLVEYALSEAIRTRLRKPETDPEDAVLFSDNGILGTLLQKTWAAYFLKIIGPVCRREIDLIRRIRNQAAHDMNPISFETPEIAGRCRELSFGADAVASGVAPDDPRWRFLTVASFLAANILMRANDANAEIERAFSGLAPTLDQ